MNGLAIIRDCGNAACADPGRMTAIALPTLFYFVGLNMRALLLGFIGLLVISAAVAQDFNLVAKVNGEGITRDRLQSSVDASMERRGFNYGGVTQPRHFKRLQRQALEQLIAQELLWQKAEQEGFVAAAEELDEALAAARKSYPSEQAYLKDLERNAFTMESFREDLRRKISVRKWAHATLASEIQVSDAEIHDFYVANQVRFVQPEQINARHVLIKLAPGADDDATAAARDKIEQLLEQARAGSDFADLAKKHSQGPSAPRGGELGFVPRGRLVKDFEDAAFALETGEISDVVRTEFGFHIIQIIARRDGQAVPEQQVAAPIRQHLFETKFLEAVAERVRVLRKEASVEILIPL